MSELTIPERVAAGAAWLDENRPGWVEAIDLDALAMASCAMCVLGQTFGNYFDAPLTDAPPDTAEEIDDFDAAAFRLGFQSAGPPGERRREYPLLGAEWRRLIESRRTGAVTE